MGVCVLQFQSILGSYFYSPLSLYMERGTKQSKRNLDPRTKLNNFELNSLACNKSQIGSFVLSKFIFNSGAEVNKTEQVNYLFMNLIAISFVVSPLRLGVSYES